MYKKAYGEKMDADVPATQEWLTTTLADILHRYETKNIFNGDETGLLWRAMPNGSHVFKSTKYFGSKLSKERVIILDSEKKSVLVIGKSKTPRCFRGIQHLPVNYKSNTNAWMTCSIYCCANRIVHCLLKTVR